MLLLVKCNKRTIIDSVECELPNWAEDYNASGSFLVLLDKCPYFHHKKVSLIGHVIKYIVRCALHKIACQLLCEFCLYGILQDLRVICST
jgi:hypothetical protein